MFKCFNKQALQKKKFHYLCLLNCTVVKWMIIYVLYTTIHIQYPRSTIDIKVLNKDQISFNYID